MGITIHYRGSISDLDRVEDLEDRVLDFSLAAGASASIWRSACVDSTRGFIRGVRLDLAPGQETTSLLLSPEGRLLPLMDIKEAERAVLGESPWCFVKTEFGTIEAHVLLIELLTGLKNEFLTDLEVIDEGGYWERRDFGALCDQFARSRAALDMVVDGLKKYGLSAEAAEDTEILATRIERIAQSVAQSISRPSEHAPVSFDDDLDDALIDPDTDETRWKAFYAENRRKQERLHRAMQERRDAGEDPGEALQNAMRDEGLVDLPDESAFGPKDDECDEASIYDDDNDIGGELLDQDDDLPDEPWKESLPEAIADQTDPHPLVLRATELMVRFYDVVGDADQENAHVSVLLQGGGDIMGGLAQALGESILQGWNIVQLKRALRGVAFARGALAPLRVKGVVSDGPCRELLGELDFFESEIYDELTRLRDERSGQ